MAINIQAVPSTVSDPQMRAFLTDLRNAVIALQTSFAVPDDPSNFSVTAGPGNNTITFTRSSNADKFIIYWSTDANFGDAVAVDVGLAQQWTDQINAGNITRYYWLKARRGTLEGSVIGPKIGTTLALGVPITPVEPPVASDVIVTNDSGDEVPGLGRVGRTDYL